MAKDKAINGKKSFLTGVSAAMPVMVGYFPMAVAFGMISVQSGISPLLTVLMSILVYAGASQFMAANMFFTGAGLIEIVLATLVLNLRHFIMSMSAMQLFQSFSERWKAGLAFGITDETFALISIKSEDKEVHISKEYTAGLFAASYGSWVLGTLTGSFLSSVIPPVVSAGMSVTLYAMFIGLLVPAVRKEWRNGIIAATSMVYCTVFGFFLGKGWAIVLATILGGMTGIFLKRKELSE